MEKLLIDERLKSLYFKSNNAIAISSGKILTTDFTTPTIKDIRAYVKDSNELLDGKFKGSLLTVEIADKQIIENFLDSGLNRTHQDSTQEKESNSIVAENYIELLTKAANLGSSDIHIELYENETQIFAGVDGERIFLVPTVPEHEYGKRLFSYIFTSAAKSKRGDFVSNDPNDGRLIETLMVNGESRITIWRASYIPADKGGKITLRWLNKETELPTLESIGWTSGHIAIYRQFLNAPSGICIIAGKVGSGKSTTIACGLKEIDKSRTVHTLEDPVEFDLGVMQTVVTPNKTINDESESRGFAYYSKVLLRHAVDVEMHGEVRDHAGAMEVTRKGETGQLVLTTVHSSSGIGVAPTFIEQFNIPPSVVSAPDLMRLWVYQTLIRTLCTECSFNIDQARDFYQNSGDIDKFTHWETHLNTLCEGDIDQVRFKNPQGCKLCDHKGEKGRTAVVEMIVLDDEDREFILNKDYLAWQKALKDKGFKDIRWHTITKIKSGLIDIDTASKRINNLLPVSAKDVYATLEASQLTSAPVEPEVEEPTPLNELSDISLQEENKPIITSDNKNEVLVIDDDDIFKLEEEAHESAN